MIASKLLKSIDRVFEAVAAAGPEAQVGGMVHELRLVQSDLFSVLEEIDRATDDVDRLRAMQRWNESAQWAEMLMNTLCELLKQPVPI